VKHQNKKSCFLKKSIGGNPNWIWTHDDQVPLKARKNQQKQDKKTDVQALHEKLKPSVALALTSHMSQLKNIESQLHNSGQH
jgi:hypothetical protein